MLCCMNNEGDRWEFFKIVINSTYQLVKFVLINFYKYLIHFQNTVTELKIYIFLDYSAIEWDCGDPTESFLKKKKTHF